VRPRPGRKSSEPACSFSRRWQPGFIRNFSSTGSCRRWKQCASCNDELSRITAPGCAGNDRRGDGAAASDDRFGGWAQGVGRERFLDGSRCDEARRRIRSRRRNRDRGGSARFDRGGRSDRQTAGIGEPVRRHARDLAAQFPPQGDPPGPGVFHHPARARRPAFA